MNQEARTPHRRAVARTGIPGLDHVLGGGLTPRRMYLVEGVPGAGKTTLGMQFLLEGARVGERVLYLTLSETDEELREVAASHGWSLDGIHVSEVIPTEASLSPEQQYTVFHPSEVELGETLRGIHAEIERVQPSRVVFDSLSELRLLAGSPLRYRRQVLALKHFFTRLGCTALVLDDRTESAPDLQVQSLAHGVVLLDQLYPDYGSGRRRLRVVKVRGVRFRGGNHDFEIRRGGLVVFPRVVAAPHRHAQEIRSVSTGLASLDDLLGGGLSTGTSTLIAGGPGSGKSTLAAQIAVAATLRGESAAMFLFDESPATLFARTDSLGVPLRGQVDAGRVSMQQVDPAELSPGEFAASVVAAVDEGGARVIVIDSVNGYLHAMPEEKFLTLQMHELLTYLGHRDVVTVLVGVHAGLIHTPEQTPGDVSYLADSVILLRYFETAGEVRQAISIVKKRGGHHERTIREFRLHPGSVGVGEPLREFHGVLTGVPQYLGGGAGMLPSAG